MKKSTLLFSSFLVILFFTSNISFSPSKSFVMTMVGDAPVLPEVPFKYNDIDFPLHLFTEMEDNDTGYGNGKLETTSFDAITNFGATLGRVLFYDKKLSAIEDISCGTCHLQELSFTENKAFSNGVNSLTKRNSMHLNDLAWSNDDHFTWGMKENDLHEMIILPLTDENEIGANINDVKLKLSATEYYPELFENAYGDSEITEMRIVDALVQFIESMVTFDSKFDNEAKQNFVNFSESEFLGLQLFSDNCSTCHQQGKHEFPDGVSLGEHAFEIFPFMFSNGLEQFDDDKGVGEWSEHYSGLFKSPTLRNIELTAPYMHDGRFQNLEEVIDHYSDGVVEDEWSGLFIPSGGFQFTDLEKRGLIDFMKTLTDNSFITNPKWSDPFESTTSSNNLSLESVALYPNPMIDKAVIKFANPDNKYVSINIVTQEGRLVKHERINTNQYELNKADYHIGVYFVQIILGNKKSTQKLIIN